MTNITYTASYAEAYERAGELWDEIEEESLIRNILQGYSIIEICNRHQMNPGGIRARIEKLINKGKLTYPQIEYLNIGISNMCLETSNVKVKKERNMSLKIWNLVSLLQEDIITVKVSFNTGKLYTYKTRDSSIKEDDYVIINKGGDLTTFDVGQVVSVDKEPDIHPDANIRYQWIICKLNLDEYNELVIKDEEAYKILVEAEKHVARKKLVDMYTETLNLTASNELKNLLK